MKTAFEKGIRFPRIVGESLYRDPRKPWRWKLWLPVRVWLSDGSRLEIPAGYTTDFATVPRPLWSIFNPFGRHQLAALIHDYLYETNDPRGKEFSDKEFRYWMVACETLTFYQKSYYLAVKLLGRRWWNKYKTH